MMKYILLLITTLRIACSVEKYDIEGILNDKVDNVKYVKYNPLCEPKERHNYWLIVDSVWYLVNYETFNKYNIGDYVKE